MVPTERNVFQTDRGYGANLDTTGIAGEAVKIHLQPDASGDCELVGPLGVPFEESWDNRFSRSTYALGPAEGLEVMSNLGYNQGHTEMGGNGQAWTFCFQPGCQ